MTRMIYVRHGESKVTVARVVGGPRTCTGLSELGVMQAERLRDRWRAAPEFVPDVVMASHYPRARETASIVAEAFGGADLVIDEGFGEHDPGPECDGLSWDVFADRHGVEAFQGDPFDVTFPGGETLAAFHYRVGSSVRRVVEQHRGGTVLIVCHGGVIDAALRQALRAPSTGGFWINTLNTSITELQLDDHRMWSLRRYGDSAHLAGLPASSRAG
jgi:probable phosphoglycerate mutase